MVRYALPIVLVLLAGCPTPEEQAVDVFTEAQLFHDEGNLEKAIAGYGLAIELDPHNAEAFLHRAEARLVSGDLDGAFEDCNKAIQLPPMRPTRTVPRPASASLDRISGPLLPTSTRQSDSIRPTPRPTGYGAIFTGYWAMRRKQKPTWTRPENSSIRAYSPARWWP